jgi:hydroxymethylpyrimidine/phosphomethylpyrimidine kinase
VPVHAAPPIVLTFAGTDPSSGAGLQADLLTLAAWGCHPLSVVTAVTAQDSTGVAAVRPIASDLVEHQARLILADMPVSAFKIGVVGNAENAAAIARIVRDHPQVPLVLDPVLASGRGDPLTDAATITAMREALVPRATVLTPNSIEARRLAAADITGEPAGSLESAAFALLALGATFVLVTGTHEPTPDVVHSLYGEGKLIRADRWQRLSGTYHGSGCTLASAIAAAIATGHAIPEAVREAQDYTWRTLAHGFRPGRGHFIPNRFVRSVGAPIKAPH